MHPEQTSPNVKTRHLNMPPAATAPAEQIPTGPLDKSLPWVIEFRVVGTASTVQAQLQESMTLGRKDTSTGYEPEVDLMPFDAFGKGVSRQHARIYPVDGRLMVKDLHSTNGTRLNNVACVPGMDYRLRHGDELMLGRLRLQVSFAVVPKHMRPHERPSVEKPAAIDGKGRRVLIIEDDRDIGSVFSRALELNGYDVTLVNDATKALGSLMQTTPHAVILDLLLPDMHGLDLVRYMRRQKELSQIPVMVISGATAGYQMGKALEAGADVFLGKPVSVEEFVHSVGTMTSQASVQR